MAAGFFLRAGDIERIAGRIADIIHSINEAFAIHLQEAGRPSASRICQVGVTLAVMCLVGGDGSAR